MKGQNVRRFLAIVLAFVLMLSLVPLGMGTQDAAQDKPELTASEEPLSEIASQTDIVNNDKPGNAEGYIIKLHDASYADGLTCVSEADSLYRAESEAQIEALPEGAVDYFEPDYKLSLLDDAAVNDTLYVNGAQWNLENMKVPAVWSKGQFGDGVTVAVIDSGLYGVSDGESHVDIDPSNVVSPYNAITGGTNE